MQTEFQILQEHTSNDLEMKAQRFLNEGWQIVNTGYAQGLMFGWFAALVKEADAEEHTR